MRNKAWIEVVSDGTTAGTRVQLVLRENGGEVRYDLPGVTRVDWRASRSGKVFAIVNFARVKANVKAPMLTHKEPVEDLLAEIAAHRLEAKDGD